MFAHYSYDTQITIDESEAHKQQQLLATTTATTAAAAAKQYTHKVNRMNWENVIEKKMEMNIIISMFCEWSELFDCVPNNEL